MSALETSFFTSEEMCSFCGVYPSCSTGDTSSLCSECTREHNFLQKTYTIALPLPQASCLSCRDVFEIDHHTEGLFCSPLCFERYVVGSFAGEVDETHLELDYDSDELESYQEEEIPSDFAPGKVYEAEGPGFYSRVKVQKDGSLKEKRGTFTPRGSERHMKFKDWNDWRAFCWPFLK